MTVSPISFTRAIKVSCSAERKPKVIPPVIKNTCSILNRKESNVFSNDEFNQIKDFLASEIKDCDPVTKNILAKSDNGIYLYTGVDARSAKELFQIYGRKIRKPMSMEKREELLESRNKYLDEAYENEFLRQGRYMEIYIESKDNIKPDKITVYHWPYHDSEGVSVLDLKA